ncbi:MAG: glycosyltransferase family 4 protein [bacterium]
MEILFISHKYPPSMGGMQKQSYELITGMEKYCKVYKIVHDGRESGLKFFILLKKRVRQMFRKHPGIELVHLNDGLMAFFYKRALPITKVPVAVTVHGLDFVFGATYFKSWLVNQYKKLDHIIAVSRSTAEIMKEAGIPPEKISVVNNGVDHDIEKIAYDENRRQSLEKHLKVDLSHKKLLMSAGRPVVRKGFSWFIKNVLICLPEDVIYLIAGPRNKKGSLYKFFLKILPSEWMRAFSLFFGIPMDCMVIDELCKKASLKNRVVFLESPPYNELLKTMKVADLFIMPNINAKGDVEGFGLVALEAAMSGAPVLVSRTEGITDAVIENGNGFLVDSGNPQAWSEKIIHLLSDREKLEKMRKKAPEFTKKHYSWEKMVREYSEVFKNMKSESLDSELENMGKNSDSEELHKI